MTAEAAIQALRDRANNTQSFTLSDEFILTEWAKEFFCEGRRRVDLVRFGQFAGSTATMTWEGHTAGKEAKYNVYPIPEAEETANVNMTGVNAEIGY